MHHVPLIKGTTRLYGLMGDPLTYAKSPELWNRLFAEQDKDAVCVPFWVKDGDLPAFVAGARTLKNLAGVLVTMPHKQRMLSLVDELHPTAHNVGALNIVRCDEDGRWVGAIFDGLGCVLGMHWEGHHPAQKSVLLLGAGGAGRAIAFAVASAGARSLNIFDIDGRRADELARAVEASTGCPTRSSLPDPAGFEVVIHATPLGMKKGDPLPLDPSRLEPGSVVVDIVNSPEPTPLYRAARERGCHTQDGRPMHEGQAVHALRFLGFDYHPDGRSLPDAALPLTSKRVARS
jgi:shikimate dehydrogenase